LSPVSMGEDHDSAITRSPAHDLASDAARHAGEEARGDSRCVGRELGVATAWRASFLDSIYANHSEWLRRFCEPRMNMTPIDNPLKRPSPHPICLLIPSADEDELQDLTDDIRAHGLIDPIVLFEGMILDGRNRAAACERAGVAPRYVRFGGGREDALILVVSHNLKRRHLSKQAIADALVAAEDFNLHYALAEPAADEGGAKAGAGAPGAKSVIKITEPRTASSRKLAAAIGGLVSHVMIAATRKVKEKGEPELQEAVKRGRIGVQDAAKAADLPPERQKAIAASPKPRRAAAEAAEAAKNAASGAAGAGPGSEGRRQASLRKAWEGAKALRGLWKSADDRTREWFVGAVLFESDEAAEADRLATNGLSSPTPIAGPKP
jgi:ParB-like chromosome segregation protein Spo0J